MDLRELQKAYLDNLRQVTEEKLEIGSLIRTIISVDEGLVFKGGLWYAFFHSVGETYGRRVLRLSDLFRPSRHF